MSHLIANTDEKTYLLKISNNREQAQQKNTIFTLEDRQTGFSAQFESPEEFATCILQYQTNQHRRIQLSPHPLPHSSTSKLKARAEMLEALVVHGKKRLEEIRFQMTDRISSARTKMGILKIKNDLQQSDYADANFDDVYHDLVELSLQIEDWNQLCEVVDSTKFGQPDDIAQMVTNLSTGQIDATAYR